ncbi:MAG: AAA family ATPase, partial [Deltaproteobacteria bacterium]|nr:AAA family ATPase [Deltaproteobacteria bacterium]
MDETRSAKKRIALGEDNFSKFIENNWLYVDKTRQIHSLVNEGSAYFLSRPRRFGKSLLLSALEALFSGPPDPKGPPSGLFKDLWIGKSDFVFPERHPIISLSMAGRGHGDEELKRTIVTSLRWIIKKENLGIETSYTGTDFSIVIEALYKKYNKEVVILIDEYEAPVSENIKNISLALQNRDTLTDFYSGLKSAGKYTRFTFVTGVTRYAFMGLSAGLNHLDDLTLDERYADICGFTREELDRYFLPYLPDIARKMKNRGVLAQERTIADLRAKILNFYDGYTWDGETKILNPYSLLKFIKKMAFNPYWTLIGAPNDFLKSIVSNNPLDFLMDKLQNLTEKDVGVAEVGSLAPAPALFQTGYLTVESVTNTEKGAFYKLRTPNEEITPDFEKLFKDSLFALLGKNPAHEGIKFKQILDSGDETKLTAIITSLYSSIPAKHHRAEESFYHSALHAYCWGILEIPPLSEPP